MPASVPVWVWLLFVQAVEEGWEDYPKHIFPKIVDGTSAILKALGIGRQLHAVGGSTICTGAASCLALETANP